MTSTLWDTSWLLPENSITGRLLHTLVGYTDAPNGAQLVVYILTFLTIRLLMRLVHGRKSLPDALAGSAP
jgi:high-affinity iron transporter